MERQAIADYPPGAQMPPRVLDDFEFVWMLAGQARVMLDGETLALMLDLFVGRPLSRPDTPATLAPALAGALGHLQREWTRMPLRRVGVGELARRASVSRGYLNR